MDILLLLGLSIFLGTLGGKICQQFKVPQVTGYILVGFLMGKNVANIWPLSTIEEFGPLINLALGLIGMMIGSELKLDIFKKRGKSIYSVLFAEALVTFFVVTAAVTLLTKKFHLGILFGALASATAPAATVDVLWENKTRGPLTTTLLAIVALDDVLALLLYGFAVAIAKMIVMHQNVSLIHMIQTPIIDIGLAFIIGAAGAFFLTHLINFIKDRERILPFSLGVVVLTIGLATYFKVDLILSSMILGFTLTNIAPVESEEIFESIKKITAPIYVLFFVMVGARLDFALIFGSGVGLLTLVYIISRTFGKMSGSVLGGFIGKSPETVTKYLGLCLFSQAGVAIGMAISINQNFSHIGGEVAQAGLIIVNVVVASTFVVQLVGPVCVRYAVDKAGEIGRGVTEDDIIASYRVSDVIEKDVPTIKEDDHLDQMVEQVKMSDSYDFCVVDNDNKLFGSVSIGDLRDVLMERDLELGSLILAKDIAVPATRVIAANRPLTEAIKIFKRKELGFLPVVKDEMTREFIGLIHYKEIMAQIQKELIERQGSA